MAFVLIDGILNLFGGLAVAGCLLCSTIVCAPLGLYSIVLGVLEIVHFNQLNDTPPRRSDLSVWLCVMQIVNVIFGNPLSLVTGILGLIAANDAAVKCYLAGTSTDEGTKTYMTCFACGFDLRGTLAEGSMVCPECGQTAPIVTAARDSIIGPASSEQ